MLSSLLFEQFKCNNRAKELYHVALNLWWSMSTQCFTTIGLFACLYQLRFLFVYAFVTHSYYHLYFYFLSFIQMVQCVTFWMQSFLFKIGICDFITRQLQIKPSNCSIMIASVSYFSRISGCCTNWVRGMFWLSIKGKRPWREKKGVLLYVTSNS